jgi:hypothetical protein
MVAEPRKVMVLRVATCGDGRNANETKPTAFRVVRSILL